MQEKGKKGKMYQNTSKLFVYQIMSMHILRRIVRLV